jgi:hypothetical protein
MKDFLIAEQTVAFPEVDLTKRIIGSYSGNTPGPNLVFFGGIHGNELSGIYALKKVIDELNDLKPDYKGTLIAIAGNLQAIAINQRFIGKDLNRIWFPGTIVPKKEKKSIPEYQEKIEILEELTKIVANGAPTFIFDLHTTSSQSMPFISISDTLKNRKIVRNIPVNMVFGLEELLDGPMFSFLSELGLPAILFEAGQHDAVLSYKNHVAFVWSMICELKALRKREIPDYSSYLQTLQKSTPGGHKAFEIKHRYIIGKDEHFKMKEGFVNFQSVEKGQTIAYNQKGAIRSARQGYIFMPLYQSQGCDGFFLVKEIKPFWLKLSSRTRRMKLDKALPLLPGIRRNKMKLEAYNIDKNIARFRVISLLHLLGFRKVQDNGNTLTMSRRPYDRRFPKASVVKKNIEAYLRVLRN